VLENFSLEEMVTAYLDLYTEVLPLKVKKTAVASGLLSLIEPESKSA
jgi:hypothetical protein